MRTRTHERLANWSIVWGKKFFERNEKGLKRDRYLRWRSSVEVKEG